MLAVVSDAWDHKYSRESAAFPGALDAPSGSSGRRWVRVESAYGDRHLVCSCLPTDAYAEDLAGS